MIPFKWYPLLGKEYVGAYAEHLDIRDNKIGYSEYPSLKMFTSSFSSCFLTPIELVWTRKENKLQHFVASNYRNITEAAILNYIYSTKFYDIPWFYINPVSRDGVPLPHAQMEEIRERLGCISDQLESPAFQQKFKDRQALFWKLKEIDSDTECAEKCEKWFETLEQIQDERYLQQTVEFYLAGDLVNIRLWKAYISHLKINDREHLLQTYSRYCRFFTDDVNMRNEYREAAVAYGSPVKVTWKNPFDWEETVEWEEIITAYPIVPRPTKMDAAPCSMHYSRIGMRKQSFHLPSSTMGGILMGASPETLHRLQKCSKWFYLRRPVTPCHKVVLVDVNEKNQKSGIVGQSLKLNSTFTLDKIKCCRLIVANVFKCESNNKQATKMLLFKLDKILAKHVELCGQRLAWHELKFIIGGGNVTELDLVNVAGESGEMFKLEEVLRLVPKVKKFTFYSPEISCSTAESLLNMQFEHKISKLHFNVHNRQLNAVFFAKFLVKSCSEDVSVEIISVIKGEWQQFAVEFTDLVSKNLGEARFSKMNFFVL